MASRASVNVVVVHESALPAAGKLVDHVFSRATEGPADCGEMVEAEIVRERRMVSVGIPILLVHSIADGIIILVRERIVTISMRHDPSDRALLPQSYV
jgi:hypothetical protein